MTHPDADIRFGPVSHAADGALYEQIARAVKREVAAGRLKPGEALPSLRGLAASLRVSLITVKRAYEDLERERIIYLRQGLGAFVADTGLRQVREDSAGAAMAALRAAVRHARDAALTGQEIQTMLQQIIDQGDGHDHAGD